MLSGTLNIALGFLEGIGLIASPCILPILPLILSGSLAGSRKRPFSIIAGFVIFFSLFTLFSRALVQHAGLDPLTIRHVSFGLLIGLGIIMLSGTLSEKFLQLTARLMRVGSHWSAVSPGQESVLSGILFGGLTAIIWTPCAGPILAAVIVQTASEQADWTSFLTIMAFALGAGVPMLCIALFGRAVIARVPFLNTHAAVLRKSLGAIILMAVGWMIYSDTLQGTTTIVTSQTLSEDSEEGGASLQKGLASPYKAPELVGISDWINTPPLRIADLRGKVVLIDFWTYSCINCLRTLPYIKDWYHKYHDRGLVIIGVHTPEFEFEKDPVNVARAVVRNGILYPVALDSHYSTWKNFSNRYWPAHYLIDKDGEVVYQAFGEGEYDVTENNIRYLLGLKPEAVSVTKNRFNPDETPETYFGFARAENYAGSSEIQKEAFMDYSAPASLPVNGWALSGRWNVMGDRIVAGSTGAVLDLHFNARKVYFVMGVSGHQAIPVTIVFQGKRTSLMVKEHQLYDAIALDQAGEGVLQVRAGQPGLEIYTATFGE